MLERTFADWLKHRRKALDLTQSDLASQVGCSAAAVRKIEAEERRPSAQIVERLAQIFSIPQDERSAFLRFARGDLKAAFRESVEASPWRGTAPARRSNLPAPPTSLIGREQEVSQIHASLLDPTVRLVTLVGPPGIGKTRLGIETAHSLLPDFPDGVFFIALTPVNDSALVVLAIAQALDYVDTKSRPGSEQLVAGIGDKLILLVLDNCEHLIDRIATVASELLTGCPNLKILATSREAFRIRGEWLHVVHPLAVPGDPSGLALHALFGFPALVLFAERARAVQPSFELNAGNLNAVSSICARLDGLPLAIELIAARSRLMAPGALLERLTDRFVLSADGMRAASARQKTLNAAISWSYDLLSPQEQKLFACLSVFSGGFTLEAAEAMLAGMFPDHSFPDLVAGLSDKSLLQRLTDTRGEIRFYMLITIREYASACLERLPNASAVHAAHFDYFAGLARRGNREMHGPHQVKWLDLLEAELSNFRVALQWCVDRQETPQALELLGNLWWVWWLRAYSSEMLSWFEKVRAFPDLVDHSFLFARVLIGMSRHFSLQFDYASSQALLAESLEIGLELEATDKRVLAETRLWLGLNALVRSADFDAAEALGLESLALYREQEDKWGITHSTLLLGLAADDRGDLASAYPLFQECLQLAGEMGDLWNIALACRHLGLLFMKQGKFSEARSYMLRHLEGQEQIRFWVGIAIALRNLGDLCTHEGRYEEAARAYQQSLEVCREHNLRQGSGEIALLSMGLMALHEHNYEQAARHLTEASVLAGRTAGYTVDLLLSFAAIASATRQPEQAATLYGAAEAQLVSSNFKPLPLDQKMFDLHINAARQHLGHERFDALAAEGRRMAPEQAIADAIAGLAP